MTEDSGCIWPKCPKVVGTIPATKLCDSHALIVWQQVDPSLMAQRARWDRTAAEVKCLVAERKQDTDARRIARRDGSLYFIRVGDHIKVGWAHHLYSRMLQYPPNSVMLATCPGTREDEEALHRELRPHLAFGKEWYWPTDALMARIAVVVAEHGEPEPVRFGALPVQQDPFPVTTTYLPGA